ncbi:uncharacterized protein [Anabrus simplex]|uniref:uncharacterized protein n=1 Tax=Anabrus simplex TaxID=316456 RepID=UPI0035A29ACD
MGKGHCSRRVFEVLLPVLAAVLCFTNTTEWSQYGSSLHGVIHHYTLGCWGETEADIVPQSKISVNYNDLAATKENTLVGSTSGHENTVQVRRILHNSCGYTHSCPCGKSRCTGCGYPGCYWCTKSTTSYPYHVCPCGNSRCTGCGYPGCYWCTKSTASYPYHVCPCGNSRCTGCGYPGCPWCSKSLSSFSSNDPRYSAMNGKYGLGSKSYGYGLMAMFKSIFEQMSQAPSFSPIPSLSPNLFQSSLTHHFGCTCPLCISKYINSAVTGCSCPTCKNRFSSLGYTGPLSKSYSSVDSDITCSKCSGRYSSSDDIYNRMYGPVIPQPYYPFPSGYHPHAHLKDKSEDSLPWSSNTKPKGRAAPKTSVTIITLNTPNVEKKQQIKKLKTAPVYIEV